MCEPLGKWTRHWINLNSPCLLKQKSPECSAGVSLNIPIVAIAMVVEQGGLFSVTHFWLRQQSLMWSTSLNWMCYIITARMQPPRANIFCCMSKAERCMKLFGMVTDGGCYTADLWAPSRLPRCFLWLRKTSGLYLCASAGSCTHGESHFHPPCSVFPTCHHWSSAQSVSIAQLELQSFPHGMDLLNFPLEAAVYTCSWLPGPS